MLMELHDLRRLVKRHAKALRMDYVPAVDDDVEDDMITFPHFPKLHVSGNVEPFLFVVEQGDTLAMTPFETPEEFLALMDDHYPQWHNLSEAYILAAEVNQSLDVWFAHPDLEGDTTWSAVRDLYESLKL